MPYHVYVSVTGDHRINIYSMSRETGRLEEQGVVAVEGGPAPMVASPDERFVYVGLRTGRRLSAFRVDHTTGGLSQVGSCVVDSDPCFVSTDSNGRYLLSTYYRAGVVSVHRIGDNGAVLPPPVEWRHTAERAHSIQTDPTNRFAFVPHVVPSNTIFQFGFDERTGRLSPSSPPQVTPSVEEGPRHFCFHPSLDVVYTVNEQGGSVTVYRLDPAKGKLKEFQRISTLPEGFEDSNACAEIRITPDGDFVYATNRGHDSIACFSVSKRTGELLSIGHQATEATPRSLIVDPAGEFLLVAGQGSGNLVTYRIEEAGGLTPLDTTSVGPNPSWVLLLNLAG